MLPTEVSQEFSRIVKRVLKVCGVLAISATIFGNIDAALGIIIGGVMSVLNFRLMAISAVQIVDLKDPVVARGRAVVKYLIRYALAGGVLYVAFITPEISFAAVAVGLLLVKYAILFDGVINSAKNAIFEFWKNQKLKYERRDS